MITKNNKYYYIFQTAKKISMFICMMLFMSLSIYGQSDDDCDKKIKDCEKKCDDRIDSLVKNKENRKNALIKKYSSSSTEINILYENVKNDYDNFHAKIDKLRKNISKKAVKDSLEELKQDNKKLWSEYEIDLKNIVKKCEKARNEYKYEELICQSFNLEEWETNINEKETVIAKIFNNWKAEIDKKEKEEDNTLRNIIVIGCFVIGLLIIGFVFKKITKKPPQIDFTTKITTETKESEWDEIAEQYPEIRKKNDPNDLEYFLIKVKNFIKMTPKELHQDEATTIINDIKSKIQKLNS